MRDSRPVLSNRGTDIQRAGQNFNLQLIIGAVCDLNTVAIFSLSRS